VAHFVGFSIIGLLTDWVNQDLLVGPFPENQTVSQFSPNLQRTPDAGGTCAVSIRNAADGGGDALSVVFDPGEYNENVSGSFEILAGAYAYVRVTAEAGDPMDLGGFFVVSASLPTVDISDEPLTLGEVKAHLGIKAAETGHDSTLEGWIARVREEAERLTGRPIVSQTKSLTLDRFPAMPEGVNEWWDGVRDGPVSMFQPSEIQLPEGNLQSVSAVTTYNDSDAATVMDAGDYFVDTTHNRIVARTGVTWPTVLRVANGIIITYVAGYATPSVVPGDLKARMLERIKMRWEARRLDKVDPRIGSEFYLGRAQVRIGGRDNL
jgi:hypothetical protein